MFANGIEYGGVVNTLYLFTFRKNLALEIATFPLRSEPFVQHAG